MNKIQWLAIVLASWGGAALADDPKFDYGKPPEAPKPEEKPAAEYKLQMKGGLLLTTGNARSLSVSGGVLASRKDARTKLTLEGGATFAQADVRVAHDDNMNGLLEPGEDARETKTTSNAWF